MHPSVCSNLYTSLWHRSEHGRLACLDGTGVTGCDSEQQAGTPALRPCSHILNACVRVCPGVRGINLWYNAGMDARSSSEPVPSGYRQLLRENRNLRRLWWGQVVSQMGDWFSGVAVIALLIEIAGDRSGTAVAAYALARHLPLFLMGPVAGVAADRYDRRRLLIAADVARAFLALGYLMALHTRSVPILYVVTAGLAGVSIFFNTARSALLPAITTRSQVMLANALAAATFGSTLAVGSLLGGMISALLGRAPAFVLNAVSFLASAAFIAGIRAPATAHDGAPRAGGFAALWEDVREGIAAVRRHPSLPALVLLPAGWALGTGAARVVYSLYGAALGQDAMAEWVRNPRDFGIAVLYAAMGAGALLGTFLARRLAGRPPQALVRALGNAVLLDGAGLAAFSLSHTLGFAAAVLCIRETGYALWLTSQQTLVMLLTPDAVRGRVFAAQESLATLAMMLSMLAAGPAIDRFGLPAVTLTAGATIVAAALLFRAQRVGVE